MPLPQRIVFSYDSPIIGTNTINVLEESINVLEEFINVLEESITVEFDSIRIQECSTLAKRESGGYPNNRQDPNCFFRIFSNVVTFHIRINLMFFTRFSGLQRVQCITRVTITTKKTTLFLGLQFFKNSYIF